MVSEPIVDKLSIKHNNNNNILKKTAPIEATKKNVNGSNSGELPPSIKFKYLQYIFIRKYSFDLFKISKTKWKICSEIICLQLKMQNES